MRTIMGLRRSMCMGVSAGCAVEIMRYRRSKRCGNKPNCLLALLTLSNWSIRIGKLANH